MQYHVTVQVIVEAESSIEAALKTQESIRDIHNDFCFNVVDEEGGEICLEPEELLMVCSLRNDCGLDCDTKQPHTPSYTHRLLECSLFSDAKYIPYKKDGK